MAASESILECTAAVSGVLAGIFFVLEKYQAGESQAVRQAIERFWKRVSLDRWLSLPETAVRAFLRISRIRWQLIEYLVLMGGARFGTAAESVALMSPVLLMHVLRFPMAFKISVIVCALAGFLSYLTSIIVFPSRFLPNRKPTGAKQVALRILEPITNLGVAAMLLLLGVQNTCLEYLSASSAVAWAWLSLPIASAVLALSLAVRRWFPKEKVRSFMARNIVEWSFAIPTILVIWFLYFAGTLDVSRIYAASASVIGVHLATRGGVVSWIGGLGLLLIGAHILALCLYSFCRPAAATICAITKSRSVDEYEEKTREIWALFFVSLLMTATAMAMGSYLAPRAEATLTVRLLLSNFLCDSLTIVATIRIFKGLRCAETGSRIPTAALLSLAIGATCAFSSLFFGLLGTDKQMSAMDVLAVMIGRDPGNPATRLLDGYFFLMHTTFVPLALYLAVCLVLWWAKLTLKLSRFLLIPENRTQRPYGLVRASFMLLAAVCALARLISALSARPS